MNSAVTAYFRFDRPVSPLPGLGINSFWCVAGDRRAVLSLTKRPVFELRWPVWLLLDAIGITS